MKSVHFSRLRVVLALFSVAGVRWFSLDRDRVEHWYSMGLYPKLAIFFRTLLGWLPFSAGDLIYLAALSWLLYRILRIFMNWRRGTARSSVWELVSRFIWIAAIIYIYFNLAWGLNYDRRGIAAQLGLNVETARPGQLDTLADELLQKSNEFSWTRINGDLRDPVLKSRAIAAYGRVASAYSFLKYQPVSFKNSLYGLLGNYMGYSGYYNPFTGEAQVNNRIPRFSLPFVALHEIAHQLGYAKENEANFVGYLAAKSSGDSAFMYATYFEFFLYANSALYATDSLKARKNLNALSDPAKRDLAELRSFSVRYENPLDRIIDVFYDRYLRMNKQPAGQATYHTVILWLIAYKDKFREI